MKPFGVAFLDDVFSCFKKVATITRLEGLYLPLVEVVGNSRTRDVD